MDVTQLTEERPPDGEDAQLKAILEAVVYITDEPLSAQQMAAALQQPIDKIKRILDEIVAEFAKPEHGLAVREVAGGYKMATKPEHHEAVRAFVKKLTPPLKLSLPALETLAVIAYKQPVTAPEIMEIRGVQGVGVLKTLLDRKLIAESGRKNVVGKPILYKTTKEFLMQFGLKDVAELPTLKEFEELGRLQIEDEPAAEAPTEAAAVAEATLVEEIVVDPVAEAGAPGLEDEPPPSATEEPEPANYGRTTFTENPLASRRRKPPQIGGINHPRPRHRQWRGRDRTRFQGRF